MAKKKIETKFAKSGSMIAREELDGTILILDIESGDVFRVFGLSAQFWRGINGRRTQKQVIEFVEKKEKIRLAGYEKEVTKVFADLEKKRIIVSA